MRIINGLPGIHGQEQSPSKGSSGPCEQARGIELASWLLIGDEAQGHPCETDKGAVLFRMIETLTL